MIPNPIIIKLHKFSKNTDNAMITVYSKHKTEFPEKNKSAIRKLYLA